MSRLQVDWHEDEVTLKRLYQQEKDHQNRTRLQALWYLRQGRTIGEVAELVGVHYRTVQDWVAWYRQGGIREVLSHRHGGARPRERRLSTLLEPDGQAHGEALKTLPGVTHSVKLGDKWRLYRERPSGLLPDVVDYARERDLKVVSLSTLGPSLEDVFLEITGQGIGAVRHETEEPQARRPGARGRGGRR